MSKRKPKLSKVKMIKAMSRHFKAPATKLVPDKRREILLDFDDYQ